MSGRDAIRRLVILGGGTAGWIAASALAMVFQRRIEITVVESPDIPIVGVGEATIPPILDFLRFLGVDEQDFIASTEATYKLGIVFQDWQRQNHHYWHPFGTLGGQINNRPFHHYWHRAQSRDGAERIADFSLAASLAGNARFLLGEPGGNPYVDGLRHAYHFDAALVGQYLRRIAESRGVVRLQANVVGCTHAGNGHIQHLILSDGNRLEADLFIDCSGFRGVLIGEMLRVPYHDWRAWLPCDRAVAVPSAILQPRPPYTLAAAHDAGWRWQIPLQHRTGNGVVYCSRWMDDAAAEALLLRSIGGAPLSTPRHLRFTPGRRDIFWGGNCVALGLASGFLEPLESTSIHFVISGITRLLDHFPDHGFAQSNIDAYNRTMIDEFDAVRDFIILHYCLTRRRDSPFWEYCAGLDLPASLLERITLYADTGRIIPKPAELFSDLSWFHVLNGMGMTPRGTDPIAGLPASDALFALLTRMKSEIAGIVRQAPTHDSFFAAARKAAG